MISQQVLIPELDGDLAADVLKLISRFREEHAPSGGIDQILDRGAARASLDELFARIDDADRKNLNVLFFDELFDIGKRVAAVVVLTIGDQQQCLSFVGGAFHFSRPR